MTSAPSSTDDEVNRKNKRVAKIQKLEGNGLCADCPTEKPLWVSFLKDGGGDTPANLKVEGALCVVICDNCAPHHHLELGKEFCSLKYLKYAHEWSNDELDAVERCGNSMVNNCYEAVKMKYDKNIMNPNPDEEYEARAKFIRNKYFKRKHRDDAILEKTLEYMFRRGASSSSSKDKDRESRRRDDDKRPSSRRDKSMDDDKRSSSRRDKSMGDNKGSSSRRDKSMDNNKRPSSRREKSMDDDKRSGSHDEGEKRSSRHDDDRKRSSHRDDKNRSSHRDEDQKKSSHKDEDKKKSSHHDDDKNRSSHHHEDKKGSSHDDQSKKGPSHRHGEKSSSSREHDKKTDKDDDKSNGNDDNRGASKEDRNMPDEGDKTSSGEQGTSNGDAKRSVNLRPNKENKGTEPPEQKENNQYSGLASLVKKKKDASAASAAKMSESEKKEVVARMSESEQLLTQLIDDKKLLKLQVGMAKASAGLASNYTNTGDDSDDHEMKKQPGIKSVIGIGIGKLAKVSGQSNHAASAVDASKLNKLTNIMSKAKLSFGLTEAEVPGANRKKKGGATLESVSWNRKGFAKKTGGNTDDKNAKLHSLASKMMKEASSQYVD